MNSNIASGGYIHTQEEVMELIERSHTGDKDAQDELVRSNVGLVSTVVKRFMSRGYEYEDLFQIGCIGLLKAIKNFDTSYNVRFSTYAVPMIMGEIKRFMRDDGPIKVSRNLKETGRKVRQVKEKLSKKYGRDVTVEEVAMELCITCEDVVMGMESLAAPEYLYDTIRQDDGAPVMLIDKIGEDKDYGSDVIDKVALKELINELDPKSRQVIMLRYFKDMTQQQVAEMLGISQVQVSRIEKKVLEYMKKAMG